VLGLAGKQAEGAGQGEPLRGMELSFGSVGTMGVVFIMLFGMSTIFLHAATAACCHLPVIPTAVLIQPPNPYLLLPGRWLRQPNCQCWPGGPLGLL
jgi:hypothetical protein